MKRSDDSTTNVLTMPRWLSPKEAAKALGIAPRTLRKRGKNGLIERRREGRRMLYRVDKADTKKSDRKVRAKTKTGMPLTGSTVIPAKSTIPAHQKGTPSPPKPDASERPSEVIALVRLALDQRDTERAAIAAERTRMAEERTRAAEERTQLLQIITHQMEHTAFLGRMLTEEKERAQRALEVAEEATASRWTSGRRLHLLRGRLRQLQG